MRARLGSFLSFAMAGSLASAAGASSGADSVRAASVLLGEFETVFYSGGSRASPPGRSADVETGPLGVPFADLLGASSSLDKRAPADFAAGEMLVGAKDFEAPSQIGSVGYTFCYVVVLSGRSGLPPIAGYFRAAEAGESGGVSFWHWLARRGPDIAAADLSFYAATVGKSYLVVSNDVGELTRVFGRLGATHEDPPGARGLSFPDGPPRGSYWGYRRIPLEKTGGGGRGPGDFPSGSRALVLSLNKRPDSFTLGLVGPAVRPTPLILSPGLPPLRPSGSGRWQAIVTISSSEGSEERLFVVMGLFGFEIAL